MKKRDLKSLQDAVNKAPNNIALRMMLAVKQYKNGDFDESEKNYQLILKQDANNVKAKQGLVELFFAKENFSAVIVIAEELIQKNVANEKILELLSKSLLRQDNIKEAQEIYERILDQNPFYFDDELEAVLEDKSYYKESDGEDADFDEEDEDEDFDFEGMERMFQPFSDDHLFVIETGVSLDDVIGLDDLIKIVQVKMRPFEIKDDPIYSIGFQTGAKILLYGPPGCGKTHFAKALPADLECPLLPVGLDKSAEIMKVTHNSYIHHIFDIARRKQRSILFMDDVEYYAMERMMPGQNPTWRTTSLLIAELDNLHGSNEDVLFLAATSNPWMLDTHILRAGRMDYIYFVPPPNHADRIQFLQRFLNLKTGKTKVINILAEMTKGYSYADLQYILDRAIDRVVMREIGKANPHYKFITQDFIDQIESHSGMVEPWFEQFFESMPKEWHKHQIYLQVQEFYKNYK